MVDILDCYSHAEPTYLHCRQEVRRILADVRQQYDQVHLESERREALMHGAAVNARSCYMDAIDVLCARQSRTRHICSIFIFIIYIYTHTVYMI